MPTIIQQWIGVLVRAAILMITTWVAAHGGPSFTNDQVTKVVTDITPVLAVLLWSFWQKYKSRQKLLTAQASPIRLSERHVEMLVASGQAPSVMTERHELPSLEPAPPAAPGPKRPDEPKMP